MRQTHSFTVEVSFDPVHDITVEDLTSHLAEAVNDEVANVNVYLDLDVPIVVEGVHES